MKKTFITFEGGEGSGKTTQSKLLYEYYKNHNIKVLWTREPGGTEIGEKIREMFVTQSLSPDVELLLLMAARADHINKVIIPALESGTIVICDRFIDSTYVYQGLVKKIGAIKY
jgi:dTMP kinase